MNQAQADRIEKNQERILALLHKLLGNISTVKEWASYEEAKKIFPRSKEWFQMQRRGEQAVMIQGEHWRKVGANIEYNLPNLEKLKEELALINHKR